MSKINKGKRGWKVRSKPKQNTIIDSNRLVLKWIWDITIKPLPNPVSRLSQENEERVKTLLWWDVWWRTSTSISIFRLASDFSNLTDLLEQSNRTVFRRKKKQHNMLHIFLMESLFFFLTFIVLTAISQAWITDPFPSSKEKMVLSSRVESNTSPDSARTPSYCTAPLNIWQKLILLFGGTKSFKNLRSRVIQKQMWRWQNGMKGDLLKVWEAG